MNQINVPQHAVVSHLLAQIRDERVLPHEFRVLTKELAAHLTYEAIREWPTETFKVRTPLGVDADVERWAGPAPILIPILRAGLGMLEGALRVLPEADVGVIGLRKDPVTFIPDLYCLAVPSDLTGRHAIVLDPMIATGNTISAACSILQDRGCSRITALCLIAAPPGLATLEERCPNVSVIAGSVDPVVDSRAFIVPGLGDAGDRLFGPP